MAEPTLLKTALFDWHQAHGGRIVEFGGWLMPVQYSTISEEHLAVRQRVGVFDISHMGRLTFDGPGVLDGSSGSPPTTSRSSNSIRSSTA